MPIGEKTIPETFPKTQHNPGKKGDDEAKKMQFPGHRKDPAKQIEQHKQAVKYKKEIIKKFEQKDVHLQKCLEH